MRWPLAAEVSEALIRVAPYIHRTPVLTSGTLNAMAGCNFFFKCENFQRMGAFKMRGAVNAIMQLDPRKLKKGVVTHSSGNFAQALALAAKLLKTKAYLVMPENAPQVKMAAVREYEGEIILCKATQKDREETATTITKNTGATFIHPYDDWNVILGQSTVAQELLQDYPDLDVLIAPVGGGGLLAGCCLAVSYHSKSNCQVYGAEPMAVDDAYRSLVRGTIQSNTRTETIADGLRTNLGEIPFLVLRELAKEIIRVDEEEIVHSMKLIYERLKIVVEPSCAVPLAAILRESKKFKSKKVGVILSGGNVDLGSLPF